MKIMQQKLNFFEMQYGTKCLP